MSCKTTANIGNSTVKDPTEESLKGSYDFDFIPVSINFS